VAKAAVKTALATEEEMESRPFWKALSLNGTVLALGQL
jgi:hypothetical protein